MSKDEPRREEYEVEAIEEASGVPIDEKKIADLKFDRVPTRDLEVEAINEEEGEAEDEEKLDRAA